MDNLILRMLAAAARADTYGDTAMAELLTEAIKEIENARLFRSAVDSHEKHEGASER